MKQSNHKIEFALRWKDQRGQTRKKFYPSERDARRARSWLLDKGCTDVDLAVRIKDKDHPVQNQEDYPEDKADPWWQK